MLLVFSSDRTHWTPGSRRVLVGASAKVTLKDGETTMQNFRIGGG